MPWLRRYHILHTANTRQRSHYEILKVKDPHTGRTQQESASTALCEQENITTTLYESLSLFLIQAIGDKEFQCLGRQSLAIFNASFINIKDYKNARGCF